MKKYGKLIGLLCLSGLVGLAGCTSSAGSDPESTEAETAALSVAETAEETGSTQEKGSAGQIDGQEGTLLTEELLAEYQELFDQYGTWYSQALTSTYETAAEVDLYAYFYNGIPGADEALSDQEEEFLHTVWEEFDGSLDVVRIPAGEMDAVLSAYFGLSLDQTDQRGVEEMPYLEETDCYYIYKSDSNAMKVTPHSGYELADGTVALHYISDVLTGTEEEYVVVVRPTDDGVQVVSNLPLD